MAISSLLDMATESVLPWSMRPSWPLPPDGPSSMAVRPRPGRRRSGGTPSTSSPNQAFPFPGAVFPLPSRRGYVPPGMEPEPSCSTSQRCSATMIASSSDGPAAKFGNPFASAHAEQVDPESIIA